MTLWEMLMIKSPIFLFANDQEWDYLCTSHGRKESTYHSGRLSEDGAGRPGQYPGE
jgi:hypothetical protein